MRGADLDLRFRFGVAGMAGALLLAVILTVALNTVLTSTALNHEATSTQEFLQSVLAYERSQAGTANGSMPELVAHIQTIPRVLRANLYGVDGRIVWSTDQEMTGQRFHNPELARALAGHLVNEVGVLGVDDKSEHAGLAVPADGRFVEAYLPMRHGAEIVCVVELYKTSAALEAAVARGSHIIAGSAILGGLVPVAGLYWIVRRGARQIERQRVDLDRMRDHATVGQAIGVIAHSLRHPLATVRQLTELLPARPDQRPGSAQISDNIDRLDRYVREVASMAQVGAASPQPVDPFFVVRAAVSRQRAALRRAGVEVVIDDRRQARRVVEVDPLILVQAMASILTEASRDGAQLRVVLSEPDSEHTRIDFAAGQNDVSAGSGGTSDTDGLGLTLARRMIEQSNASLDVLHQDGRGALVRITLRAGR